MAAATPFSGKVHGVKREAKSLLKNVLRHTGTHNRLLEENEMWQQYYKMKDQASASSSSSSTSSNRHQTKSYRSEDELSGSRGRDRNNSFLYDDRQDVHRSAMKEKRLPRHAHMDDDEHKYSNDWALSEGHVSTYWMRQLQKTEEGDTERWGHNGFKELYPAIFDSDRSTQGDSESSDDHGEKREKRSWHKSSRTRKRRKSEEREKTERKKRHKRKKLKRKHVKQHSDSENGKSSRKKRKHKHHNDSESDSENGESPRWKRKHKHHSDSKNGESPRRKRKHKHHSDSDSDSENGESSRKKKKNKHRKDRWDEDTSTSDTSSGNWRKKQRLKERTKGSHKIKKKK